MKMEGEIISRDFIKPSSLTTDSLNIYKLSLLDQIVPPIYVPFVLYYPANPGYDHHNLDTPDEFITKTVDNLRQSLSSTLSDFYPLAGRLRDNLSVDCFDEGALFVVCRFDYSLTEFLKCPDPVVCRSHIPSELSWTEPGPGDRVSMFQVTFFSCGGMAIGGLFFHKVVDGVSIGTFMKVWAARARNSSESLPAVSYKAMSAFPQNELMRRESHLFSAMRRYFKYGGTVMRRYVIDAAGIAKLRASAVGLKRRPTRVELVSALMWRCFLAAVDKTRPPGGGGNPVSVVTHGVNMRRKADPPLPDGSFGNFVWLVPVTSSNDGGHAREFNSLLGKLREAIDRVDSEFVKSMEGSDGFAGYCRNQEEAWESFPESGDYLAISSWCNFGLYGIDFGLGKPAWISKCDAASPAEWPFINVLWLMDTRQGDGVEAWATLDEKCFQEFDENRELRDVARVDPSPLFDTGLV